MKSTGVVRAIDHLGRIVIPAEVRRLLLLDEGTPLEICVDGDSVVLKKHRVCDHIKETVAGARALVGYFTPEMHPAVAAEVADLLEKAEKLLIENET